MHCLGPSPAIARHARRARQRVCDAAAAIAAEAVESESDGATVSVQVAGNPWRHIQVVELSGSGNEGSIVDVTSTGHVEAMGSDEKE